MPNPAPNDKPPLRSKKFIGFLLVEIGFFVLMGMMVCLQEIDTLAENTAFIVLAICASFLAVGFILGQASLDRFVRVAEITVGKLKPEPGDSEDEEP